MNKTKIFVRGISEETTKAEVKAIIREFCECENVYAKADLSNKGNLKGVEIYPTGSKSMIGYNLYDVVLGTPVYYGHIKRRRPVKVYALKYGAINMGAINMDSIKVQVKDVANFLDNLDGFDYRVMAAFYNEDGFYMGQIGRNCKDGHLVIDNKLRAVWRNNVKFYKKCALKSRDVYAFIVLKGEEK